MMAAQRCFDEALRVGRTFEVRSGVPFACTGLGLVYDQGLRRHREAEPSFAEALAIFRATGPTMKATCWRISAAVRWRSAISRERMRSSRRR
jgi:hypothetical protein